VIGVRTGDWAVRIGARSRPRMRLFCVPYAGAGIAAYRDWPAGLPDWLEVWATRLPARETRLGEPPVARLPEVVGPLADHLSGLDPLPVVLYGHSMGALVCYELARELIRRDRPEPAHLFVSGRRAPHFPDHLPAIHDLPKAQFLERVRDLNGIPARILAEPGLIDVIEPALRADFAVCETYRHAGAAVLSAGISVFGGDEDPTTTGEQLAAWQVHTTGAFRLRMLPGDHFFLHRRRRDLLAAVVDDLATLPGAVR
jgi:medium-chain acyl-[acyl-carrier-protein] hydrolase